MIYLFTERDLELILKLGGFSTFEGVVLSKM